MYVFAQAAHVLQVSVGFTHELLAEASFEGTLAPLQLVDSPDAFVRARAWARAWAWAFGLFGLPSALASARVWAWVSLGWGWG